MNIMASSTELDTSKLPDCLHREVEKAGLKNCAKIVLAEPSELRKLANLTEDDIQLLKSVAAQFIIPTGFVKASVVSNTYTKRWRKISLDCPALDSILDGGIPMRGITEIYGASGVGKTQFCLQLAITVQYPEDHGGLSSGCVYICTEDRFPSKRLQQLLPVFPRGMKFDPVMLANAADHIFVDHIPDVESLFECLSKRLPVLLQNHKIGLVVVDSIAALFRSDYTNKQSVQRAKDLRAIGMLLHKLTARNNMAVFCVNQVTDSLTTNETLPALGLVWANLVCTKLHASVSPNNRRTLSVVSSPHLDSSSSDYQITSNGIEGF